MSLYLSCHYLLDLLLGNLLSSVLPQKGIIQLGYEWKITIQWIAYIDF